MPANRTPLLPYSPTPYSLLPTPIRRLVLLLLLLILPACTPTQPAGPDTFTGDLAYEWVTRQCDLGYRITGTEPHQQTGDMIIEELRDLGWDVREQTFPYMGVTVRNIIASRGEGPAVLLGAHYDTRRAADQEDPETPVMGANDGASGVAVLLELARAYSGQ